MKKVVKKLLILILIFAFFVPYNNVFGEETEIIEMSIKNCSQRYDASTGGEHDVRYAGNTAYFSVAYDDYIIFDFTASASGSYEIAVLSGYGGGSAAKTAICIENEEGYEEVLRETLVKSGSYAEFVPTVMGHINLKAGINKIKVLHIRTDVHIKGITLKRIGDISEDTITLLPSDMERGTANVAQDASYIHFETVQKAEFSVNAKAGEYAVRVFCADYLKSDVSVSSGEKEYLRYENDNTASLSVYAANRAGTINLEDGLNTITIQHTGVLNTFFRCKKIILDRIGEKKGETVSGISQMISGDFVNVTQEGYYKIHAENAEGEILYLADGEPLGSAKDENDCFIYLKSGEYVLKAKDKNGKEYFNFYIEYLPMLTYDKEKEFLSRINGAKNGNEIKNVLTEFKNILNVDFDAVPKSFGGMETVSEKLAESDYKNIGEAVAEFSFLAQLENENPHIEIYKDGEIQEGIKDGEYKLLIDASYFNKNITAVTAVYSGKRLTYSDISKDNNGKEEVSLKLADGDTYKIFYFENLSSVKSVDEKSGVYKNIYVSCTAEDSGDGTRFNPYKTINDALLEVEAINDTMTGDIHIISQGGKYEIEEPIALDERHSGKNGYNVVFKGNGAIISGGKAVTSWEPFERGIYKAPLKADYVRNLYVNGLPAVRAKSDFLYRCEEFEGNVITTHNKYLPSFSNANDIELVFDLVWHTQRLKGEQISLNGEMAEITVDETGILAAQDLNYQIKPSQFDYFYIENALELLDEEGEFYYDKENELLYYLPFENENIYESEIIVPVSSGLMQINGAENIIFDGITFAHGAWNDVSEVGYIGTQSSSMTDLKSGTSAVVPAQIKAENANNIDFLNCTFSLLGSSAINFENNVSDCMITGSLFCDISASAVTLGTPFHNTSTQNAVSGVLIKNCVFTRIAEEYKGCPAIGVYYERDVEISNNVFDTLPYSAVSLGWGWGGYSPDGWGGFKVLNNEFKNIMQVLDDGGGVYTMGRQNTVIKGNTFENFGHINYSAALHLDSGSASIKAYDNVVKNLERWLMVSQPAVCDNKIFSNYINTENTLITTEEITVTDNIMTDAELPDEAVSICNNAGVEEAYEYLEEKAAFPDGRKARIYSVPKRMKLSGTVYEAENFVNHSMYGVVELKRSSGFNPTAWTEYEIDIAEAGDYTITLYASKIGSKESFGTAEIYVENDKKTEVTISGTGETWEDYLIFESGSFSLPKGKSSLKIKCRDSAFHVECFALSKNQ